MKRIDLRVKSYTYSSGGNSVLLERRNKRSKEEAQSRKWRENSRKLCRIKWVSMGIFLVLNS